MSLLFKTCEIFQHNLPVLAVVLPAPPRKPGVLWPPATAGKPNRTRLGRAKLEGGEAPPAEPPWGDENEPPMRPPKNGKNPTSSGKLTSKYIWVKVYYIYTTKALQRMLVLVYHGPLRKRHRTWEWKTTPSILSLLKDPLYKTHRDLKSALQMVFPYHLINFPVALSSWPFPNQPATTQPHRNGTGKTK